MAGTPSVAVSSAAHLLEEALALWAQCRAPAAADVVRQAHERAISAFAPPRACTKRAFQAAWLQVAERDPSPVATGWLAATLSRLLPEERLPAGLPPRRVHAHVHGPLLERIRHLAARCPDPRIADAALQAFEKGVLVDWSRDPTDQLPLVQLVVEAGDPSAAVEARRIAGQPRSRSPALRRYLHATMPVVVERLETLPSREPTDAERAALACLRPRRRAVASEELLAYVLANPIDEAAREVLGDAWIEEGDPRGEMVALERSGVAADAPRIRGLVRAHRRTWLGPDLFATLQRPRFRGGLLDATALRPTSAAGSRVWRAAQEDARLATVRTIERGSASRAAYLAFVTSVVARNLRWVEVPDGEVFDALRRGPARPLEALAFRFVPSWATWRGLGDDLFGKVHTIGLPETTPVGLACQELTQAGLHHRLVRVELERRPEAAPWVRRFSRLTDELPGLRRVVWRDALGLEISLCRTPRGWEVEIRLPRGRAEEGGLWPREREWLEGLRLPRGVSRGRVVGSGAMGLGQVMASRWRIPMERVAAPAGYG